MIEIYGNINIEGAGSAGTISNGTITAQGNNVSANFNEIINNTNKVERIPNPFIIGSSKIGSGATFSGKLNYFMSKEISDQNGKFANPILISLSAYRLYDFTIVFNSSRNQYPNNVKVDGKDYFLSSPILQVSQSTEAGYREIVFDSWNVANSPIVIEKIYDGISIEINKRNLMSLSIDGMQRENAELPSWGIISNKGSIKIKDYNKHIYSLAKNKMLSSNSMCYINMRNTLVKGKQERIATMYTDNWQYDNETFIANVSLKDGLEEWQDINISPIDYNHTKSQYYPFKYMYEKLHNLTPQKFEMLYFSELNEATKEILEKTKCYYPFLKSNTLWGAWYKLCQVCQLYIYKNEINRTVCNYEFGA